MQSINQGAASDDPSTKMSPMNKAQLVLATKRAVMRGERDRVKELREQKADADARAAFAQASAARARAVQDEEEQSRLMQESVEQDRIADTQLRTLERDSTLREHILAADRKQKESRRYQEALRSR